MRSVKLLVAAAAVAAIVSGPVFAQDAMAPAGNTMAPATDTAKPAKHHAHKHAAKHHHKKAAAAPASDAMAPAK